MRRGGRGKGRAARRQGSCPRPCIGSRPRSYHSCLHLCRLNPPSFPCLGSHSRPGIRPHSGRFVPLVRALILSQRDETTSSNSSSCCRCCRRHRRRRHARLGEWQSGGDTSSNSRSCCCCCWSPWPSFSLLAVVAAVVLAVGERRAEQL